MADTRDCCLYRDMGRESASSYDLHAKSEPHFKELSQSLVKKKLLPDRYHPPNLGDSSSWQKGALWNAMEVSYKLRRAPARTISRDRRERSTSICRRQLLYREINFSWNRSGSHNTSYRESSSVQRSIRFVKKLSIRRSMPNLRNELSFQRSIVCRIYSNRDAFRH